VYRVQWLQSAMDRLSAIWIDADASLRATITQATHEIDRELRTDPVNLGESRSEKSRIVFAAPLAVLFRVDVGDRVAVVERVWLLRRRPTP
jgi:hypothetical protein